MICEAPNINHLWATLMVEELTRNGVDTFCLTPGSRCTPITTAVARQPRALSIMHYDERGAAYYALGFGRATGRPAVVVCTSGTAAANYLPAVVEAANAGVPLLVLTTDRPPELLDTGANQVIDQMKIFGYYVRWQFVLPCPDMQIPTEMVLTTLDQAVYRAERPPAGPVHLNCMFREPLAPTKTGEDFQPYLTGLSAWLSDDAPYTRYAPPDYGLNPDEAHQIMKLVSGTKRGLLVVGQLNSIKESRAASKLAASLKWPVLPDVTSGLRFVREGGCIVHYSDQLLLSVRVRNRFTYDTILHLGGPITSKRLLEQLAARPPRSYILAAPHPRRHDPIHRVTLRIEADVIDVCEILALAQANPDPGRLEELLALSKQVNDAIEGFLEEHTELSEPAVARLISKELPSDHGLFLANSMPIRDMDMFGAAVTDNPSRVAANRGASGIDGNVATAAGFAHGLQGPVTAVLGDLAVLHDLNSLALLTKAQGPVTLVVVNNDGGSIFSFLPIAGFADVFEPYFATPHGLRFDKVAEMFGLTYAHPDSVQAFVTTYRDAAQSGKSSIIEVTTRRDENLRLHQALQDTIQTVLEGQSR